jgi:hypothetical protein
VVYRALPERLLTADELFEMPEEDGWRSSWNRGASCASLFRAPSTAA